MAVMGQNMNGISTDMMQVYDVIIRHIVSM